MRQVNDFYTLLNKFLSRQRNIQQCIIKNYVEDKEKRIATCTAIVPNSFGGSKEFKNIVCYIGSAIDITFESYMQGILLNMQNQYAKAQDISSQVNVRSYNYFTPTTDSMIAIIIPHSETITNILTTNIVAKESFKAQAPKCYIGNDEINVLNELSEYLALLKEYFDNVAQAAPSISQLPADGSAKLAQASTEMSAKTDEIYQKITDITNF